MRHFQYSYILNYQRVLSWFPHHVSVLQHAAFRHFHQRDRTRLVTRRKEGTKARGNNLTVNKTSRAGFMSKLPTAVIS
jgi:hypothetical protein